MQLPPAAVLTNEHCENVPRICPFHTVGHHRSIAPFLAVKDRPVVPTVPAARGS